MKDQRKTEIKVGLTVIVGVLLLIWIIGWAKNFNIYSNQKNVTIEFSNAAGLEVGDNVTVNGVRMGSVEDIHVDGDNVLVKITLNNDVKLKKDAGFYLTMTDLMGGKKIEIAPGVSNEPLDIDKIQKGTYTADIPAVMTMLGSVQDDLVTTLQQVKIAVTSVNKYLTDQQLNDEIKSSVKNLNELTINVNKLIDENRAGIKKLTDNSVALTNEAKNFITDNKKDISGSIKDISTVLKNTDTLITRLNNFTAEIKEKKNNLGVLMYDQNLVGELKSSVKQINELTNIILEQIKKKGLKVDAKVDLF